jgi:hypothetical protein
MFGKPVYSETAKRYDRQDPDGMVKAELLESQCPNCMLSGRGMTVEKLEPGCYLNPGIEKWLGKGHLPSYTAVTALQGSWPVYNGLNKDTKRTPKPS